MQCPTCNYFQNEGMVTVFASFSLLEIPLIDFSKRISHTVSTVYFPPLLLEIDIFTQSQTEYSNDSLNTFDDDDGRKMK